jgi:formylglycine-generating enzyme required for sulfatase activity
MIKLSVLLTVTAFGYFVLPGCRDNSEGTNGGQGGAEAIGGAGGEAGANTSSEAGTSSTGGSPLKRTTSSTGGASHISGSTGGTGTGSTGAVGTGTGGTGTGGAAVGDTRVEMIDIPEGTFASANILDYHPSIAAFSMDATEVTVDAYQACVTAKVCTEPGAQKSDLKCNWGHPAKSRHPINCVDWNQATTYCAWVGKRLPTEWEWEYAANYNDERPYPWGRTPPTTEACWHKSDGTCPVGSFSPAGDSLLGLHDMAGNVWEWTNNWYCSPPPCTTGTYRIARGGSWYNADEDVLRTPERDDQTPTYQWDTHGFRCAK